MHSRFSWFKKDFYIVYPIKTGQILYTILYNIHPFDIGTGDIFRPTFT